MTFTNGSSIKFFYSAEGEKLRVKYTIGGTTTQNDYCGNIVYEANNPKYLLNDEGYYDLASGARHYDPAIARWITQDPLAEKYYGGNQYNYCGANPVKYIDPDGKRMWPIAQKYKGYTRSHLNNRWVWKWRQKGLLKEKNYLR